MNAPALAEALRRKAADLSEAARAFDDDAGARHQAYATAELVRVLARVVEGKPIARAFGAPGDWGYGTAIGAALAAPAEKEPA